MWLVLKKHFEGYGWIFGFSLLLGCMGFSSVGFLIAWVCLQDHGVSKLLVKPI